MTKEKLGEDELVSTFRFILLDEMRKLINSVRDAFKVTTKLLGIVFAEVSNYDLVRIYRAIRYMAKRNSDGRSLVVFEQLSYLHQKVS